MRISNPQQSWRTAIRIAAVAALAVVVLAGLASIASNVHSFIADQRSAGTASSAAGAGAGARPSMGAEAFAARFASLYLSYDESNAQVRQQALAPYGSDAMGWNGNGHQVVLQAIPSSVTGDAIHVQVTVAVLVSAPDRSPATHWLYLAVPVVAAQSGYALGGLPSFVAAPAIRTWQVTSSGVDADQILSDQLQPSMVAFMRAYAASDANALSYYSIPGASIQGLGGVVQFEDLKLTVYQGSSASRTALVAVGWKDKVAGASLTQNYDVSLQLQAGKWLVTQVLPAGGSDS